MPVELSWQQPRRVIYERFYGTVTLEEIGSIQQEFFHYLDNGEAPVHAIIDMSGVRDFPKSINKIRTALMADNSGKMGRMVIVTGPNLILRFITSTISQLSFKNAQFTFCTTIDEAVQYLHLRDDSIDHIGNDQP